MFLCERSIASATCSPSSMIANIVFHRYGRAVSSNRLNSYVAVSTITLILVTAQQIYRAYGVHSSLSRQIVVLLFIVDIHHRVSYFTFNLNVNALVSYHATSV